MKIEIWSDFTCPFCYIGIRKLELALEQFENNESVQIEFKSYQLDPYADSEANEKVYSVLMKKHNLPIHKVKEMTNQICSQAEEIGLHFRFDDMKHINTLNAHRLVKFSQCSGKEKEVIKRLYKGYFEDNRNIGDRNILLSVAKDVNLDEEEVDALLCLNNYVKAVHADMQMAEELGIDSVPFFIFDEQYGVSGVQPEHVFLKILGQVWDESEDRDSPNDTKQNEKGEQSYCIGNDCE